MYSVGSPVCEDDPGEEDEEEDGGADIVIVPTVRRVTKITRIHKTFKVFKLVAMCWMIGRIGEEGNGKGKRGSEGLMMSGGRGWSLAAVDGWTLVVGVCSTQGFCVAGHKLVIRPILLDRHRTAQRLGDPANR